MISDRHINFALPKTGEPLNSGQKNFLQSFFAEASHKTINVRQVHGRRVVVGSPKYSQKTVVSKADAVVTNIPQLPIAVRTADCLSVFIFDPRHKAIGVAHAGWKGTHKQIVPNAIRMMTKKFGSQAADLKIAFGPSIRACCYQVGREFKRYFPKEIKETPKGLYLNLPLVNKRQLTRLGVKRKNILDESDCTFCNEKFFSFRRQGEKAGRMISAMMLKNSKIKSQK